MTEKAAISAKDIALIGMMIATIEIAKVTMAALPNIELTSFLIILYTLYFGKRILFVIPAFILLEGCMYGFGLWWIMYLYAWPLLALIVHLFRRQESAWFWSIVSGAFGLSFGALCAIPYLFLSGPGGAFGWWVAGIPFDVIHCISNFIICLVLFAPVRTAMKKISSTFNFS